MCHLNMAIVIHEHGKPSAVILILEQLTLTQAIAQVVKSKRTIALDQLDLFTILLKATGPELDSHSLRKHWWYKAINND